MTTLKLRYILILFLVTFQVVGGLSAWAETTPNGPDKTQALCADHSIEHCGMADHSSQLRSQCSGMACSLPLLAQAFTSVAESAPQEKERYKQPLNHSLHSGYHSSLDRPPSL